MKPKYLKAGIILCLVALFVFTWAVCYGEDCLDCTDATAIRLADDKNIILFYDDLDATDNTATMYVYSPPLDFYTGDDNQVLVVENYEEVLNSITSSCRIELIDQSGKSYSFHWKKGEPPIKIIFHED